MFSIADSASQWRRTRGLRASVNIDLVLNVKSDGLIANIVQEESMTFRMPCNLSTQLTKETGAGVLDAEIFAEMAASLGDAGRRVERTLDELRNFSGTALDRNLVRQSAADAVYNYFVQRELCGFVNHDYPIEHYAIPDEVLARAGAK